MFQKPKNLHKHTDAVIGKAIRELGHGMSIFQFAKWSLTAKLTPYQRYAVAHLILKWG